MPATGVASKRAENVINSRTMCNKNNNVYGMIDLVQFHRPLYSRSYLFVCCGVWLRSPSFGCNKTELMENKRWERTSAVEQHFKYVQAEKQPHETLTKWDETRQSTNAAMGRPISCRTCISNRTKTWTKNENRNDMDCTVCTVQHWSQSARDGIIFPEFYFLQ